MIKKTDRETGGEFFSASYSFFFSVAAFFFHDRSFFFDKTEDGSIINFLGSNRFGPYVLLFVFMACETEHKLIKMRQKAREDGVEAGEIVEDVIK